MTFAIEQGRTLQIFEPFVWVFGDGISILLISLILILLFADMPFLDGASVNEATSALDKLKVTYEVAGNGERIVSTLPVAGEKLTSRSVVLLRTE